VRSGSVSRRASSNTGLWEWEPAGAAYFSPAWKRLLGYADHEIPNRFEEWSSRVHPGDLPRLMAEVDGLPETTSAAMGERVPHPSQRRVLSLVSGKGRPPECDEQGRVKRVLGAHIDITDSSRQKNDSA